ncbi:MAG: hypothetical protein MRY72_03105 [Aquisalinus sp.]|nr:hypothetical protein [Aquisalinus sp.]
MSDVSKNKQSDDDMIIDGLQRIKSDSPAPSLSDASRAFIIEAVAANADQPAKEVQASSSAGFLDDLVQRFSGGLEALLRPVALGTMTAAGVAGVAFGALMSAPAAYADLTPEQELASYYEVAFADSDFFESGPAEGIN